VWNYQTVESRERKKEKKKMAQEKPLLAACGGETVKLFDVSERTRDPCTFQYTPAPGCQVNCARWNHTSELLPLSLSLQFLKLIM
jgi:hypothetical protein